ncbi:TPA: AzlC family ABC transporter permease [Klebsiella aerogenes]|nr:AzlC family ABC transporter permease [Klebsiella aerogenes]
MNKKVILRGASAIMPLCIGDFPFSFIVGALSVSAGMSVWQSTAWSAIVIAGSAIVIAGSAQMLALNMLKTGATLGVIIFTTLIINLRHVLYSASISGTVREASFFKKCFMSYALTDEVYATTVKEMEGNKQDKYLFYGSAMITFWAIWVLADFLGALVGASFPNIEKYGLDFAMVAAFIAIVVPQIKSQACTVAAVVAAVSGVLLVILPYSLGIVVASVLGVLAGLCVDLAEERKQAAIAESDMPLVEALEHE